MDSQVKRCPLCGGIGTSLYAGLRDFTYGSPGQWRMLRCGNPSCELMWLEPRPTNKDLREAYNNYYTHESNGVSNNATAASLKNWIILGYLGARYGYKRDTISFIQRIASYLVYLMPALRQRFDMRVRKLQAHECGRVLDIGCGSGEWLQYMQSFGIAVQGLEVDPHAAKVARSRGLTVHIGALEHAAYPNHAFDTVTLSHVIEHVPSPLGLLQSCNRILRPNGLLVVSTPNSNSLGHRMFGQHWRGLEPPRHLYLMNQKNLRSMVEAAGYVVVRCNSFVHSDSIVRQSVAIAKRAHCVDETHRLQLRDRLYVRLLSFIEICMLPFRPRWGEEIYLMARKVREVEGSGESDAAPANKIAEPTLGKVAQYG